MVVFLELPVTSDNMDVPNSEWLLSIWSSHEKGNTSSFIIEHKQISGLSRVTQPGDGRVGTCRPDV